jgi:diadenosine tetraphosphate (Ap4A) HIT family hydrolase
MINKQRDHPTPSSCVFCEHYAIKKQSSLLYEDELVVAFHDIRPKANVHILVIPKQCIRSIRDVQPTEEHIALLQRMYQVGSELLEKHTPGGKVSSDKWCFGFHKPPFNSVNHLHLHCMDKIHWYQAWRYVEMLPNFVSFSDALSSLQNNKTTET